MEKCEFGHLFGFWSFFIAMVVGTLLQYKNYTMRSINFPKNVNKVKKCLQITN